MACESKKQDEKTKLVMVEKKTITTNLYYSGTIEPISFHPISFPVEGIVKSLYFEYGQLIKKGDLLASIYSKQLQDNYRNALTTFFTAKRTYQDSLTSFEGTKVLYENKIVSEEDFKNEQSRVDSNRLAYDNALYNLEQALREIPGEKAYDLEEKIKNLSFTEMAKIEEILDRKLEVVHLHSPSDGVALLPKKEDGAGGGGGSALDKEITEGSAVKKGDNLLSLGDITGIAISIKVNEIDVNRIKPGQSVDITIPALPGEAFKGEIKSIGSQAKSDSHAGGLATFPAKVVVKKITEKQRQLIRIGMTAKVSVNIQSQPQLVIPIEAVFDMDGTDMVVLVEPKTGKKKNVPIVVGKTNPEGISVISGLKEGDKVLVRY